MNPLFPALESASAKPALRFTDRTLSYARLAAVAAPLARRIAGQERVAVWATPTPETAVAIVAALLAGVPAVPVNPRTGERELDHLVLDSSPGLVLAGPRDTLPGALTVFPRLDAALPPEGTGPGEQEPAEPIPPDTFDPESPALVIYTSGTTGPPKGVVLSRRAVTATLDTLAEAWHWTGEDVVVHALPLFHVHGLVLGTLGPLRLGGTVHHLGRFSPAAAAEALGGEGTALFAVPTMYHRLAEALEEDPGLARPLAGARLLVSGSAPLPLPDLRRIEEATGRRVIERYGMSETLMNTSVRPDGPPAPGTVGVPLPGVQVRLVDDAGTPLPPGEAASPGEIQVRGPNLFTEYLNQPEATEAAFTEGWFRTGDLATRDATGNYRIIGRRSTDLIKSGGHRIGAGEIENALLDHPGVAEAAVTGEPDPDLGERIVAWVVLRASAGPVTEQELTAHIAGQLAPHKRPRTVRFRDSLPRNDLGKLLKRELR
ncbi:acyl-CoA synthetase [Streptomyces sp. ACA25]|uniref:acyl-CoA synthetase n=1 Tax=Streptomyces sp. ACA25 TaxID=3022596 RepID=UPI0023076137|nr:acyl-CoA synthetase [Streptomyces sp. ACA25]MDB1090122.1 acyl-CoA synthetase [Streptomyces sp. ACA25]